MLIGIISASVVAGAALLLPLLVWISRKVGWPVPGWTVLAAIGVVRGVVRGDVDQL